ncbi:3-isopropylmalate dehydratase, partial [Methanophagales archaeon]
EYAFKPLPEFMEKLLEMGGLVPYVKERLREKKK